MRAGHVVAIFVVPALIAVGASIFYPVYPSPRSLCELVVDGRSDDRGAMVVINGRIYGPAYDDAYFVMTPCRLGAMPVVVRVSRLTATSPLSRATIETLASYNESARVTILARVESASTGGCFSLGTVVSAVALSVTGPVETRPFSVGSAARP